jgi:hypothetical protein
MTENVQGNLTTAVKEISVSDSVRLCSHCRDDEMHAESYIEI